MKHRPKTPLPVSRRPQYCLLQGLSWWCAEATSEVVTAHIWSRFCTNCSEANKAQRRAVGGNYQWAEHHTHAMKQWANETPLYVVLHYCLLRPSADDAWSMAIVTMMLSICLWLINDQLGNDCVLPTLVVKSIFIPCHDNRIYRTKYPGATYISTKSCDDGNSSTVLTTIRVMSCLLVGRLIGSKKKRTTSLMLSIEDDFSGRTME